MNLTFLSIVAPYRYPTLAVICIFFFFLFIFFCCFFFNDTATTEIYTLSLHDALPIYEAGKVITSGTHNTLIGVSTGDAITSGDYNVAVGNYALSAEDAHGQNTAIGYGALNAQNAGADANNVAVGFQAGLSVTTATSCTLVGTQAGDALTTSPGNTLIGFGAGGAANNTDGDGDNTCVGNTSGGAITTGIFNTFVGSKSGNAGGGSSATITTGNQNTFIGYEAKGNSSSIANSSSLGYAAESTGSNQITLGNSSIGTLRCQVTSITALSDQRDKTDIETLPYGLDFVNSLQPKKFVWDNRAETDGSGNEFFSANKGKKDIGFIAQDLQNVDDDYLNLVYDNDPEKLEATYGRLIPVLVQAIKDLSAKVTALENA